MIDIRPLTALTLADLHRVAPGYTSGSKYMVQYTRAEGRIVFELALAALDPPYVKVFDHDDDTLRRYQELLREGFSFGAYDGDELVGLAIGEARAWNGSLWVWEFHVVEALRRRGLGRRLMARVTEQAAQAGLRTIVCETQTTNVPAIQVYTRLGFRLEGVDLSYYTNDDYPDGEIAVFMKRPLP